MKNLSIFIRIFLSHSFIGLGAVMGLALVVYVFMGEALLQRTNDQLSSINILKKTQIENYFRYTRESLELLHQNEVFTQEIISTDQNKGTIVASDHVIDKLKSLEQFAGFNRILMVDANLHRVAGSTDTMLLSVIKKDDINAYKIIDVSNLSPAHRPLFLHITPLVLSGKVKGYLVIEDDLSEIQNILFERTGMGNTGESYLVGSDLRLRSASRFFPEKSPLEILVTKRVFSDLPKGDILSDYRNVRVLSYTRKIESELSLTITSEIDFEEAMKPVAKLRNYLLLSVLGVMILIAVITYFLSNSISRPIISMRTSIVELSKGVIPRKRDVESLDEIGQIVEAVNHLIDAMKHKTNFAYEIGAGNFGAPFQILSNDDTLGNALLHMRSQLKDFNEREVRLVREKASAVLEAQENERKRIVLELHDGVGQLLTAISLKLERMEKDAAVRELITMINDTIVEVRRVSYNLMPSAIVDFGLEAALKGLCDNFQKYSLINFDFQFVREFDHVLDFDISIAVFRIAQEAINNISKHAGATRVQFHVIVENDEIYVMISDNGKGFDDDRRGTGFGLTTMRERARMLNGSFEIETGQDGTVIEVHIPFNK